MTETPWISDFVSRVLDANETDAIVRRLNDEIAAELPVFADDAELRTSLDASTHGQILAFLASLISDVEVRPAPEAFELAHTVARRGLDLSVLLAVYRSGQQAALRYVSEVVTEQLPDDQDRSAALLMVFTQAGRWFTTSVEQLIGAYAEERERWLRSALTRRTQMVEAILGGEDVDLDKAEMVLGHPLRRRQTALVLSAPDASDATARLEGLAARFATVLSAPRPLLVPMGARTLWAWFATDAKPDVRLLATTRLPTDGARIGVGTTASGLAGFRTSHREAVAAHQETSPSARLVLYGDVELVSLLSADREAVRTFVRRELGPLADPDAAKLRETVLAYLSGGVNEAADRLRVHRNTVRYRVQQAEGMLGRSVEERRLELHLALLCADR